MRKGKVSISDIAEAAGVSKTLVSFALSDKPQAYRVSPETAKRIKAIADEMGFVRNSVAASLRTGKTHTIGVIITDISNRFFADIARSIEDFAAKAGYSVIFGSSDDRPERLRQLINIFCQRGVDGLILVPCDGAREVIEEAIATGVPVVLMDRTYPELEVSSVTLDNVKATGMAVEELVSNEYQRIALVSYRTSTSNIVDREKGYADAMINAGLGEYISILRVDSHLATDQISSIVETALERGVEALVFVTNRMSIRGLLELDRLKADIPGKMAVVAFDGSETLAFDLFHTGISYVRQPVDEYGEKVCAILFSMLDSGSTEIRRLVLQPEMVSSDSSGKK